MSFRTNAAIATANMLFRFSKEKTTMLIERSFMTPMKVLALLSIPILASCATAASSALPLDSKQISEASGSIATMGADGVVRIGWSRTDVAVTVNGKPFPAPAGLGSWAAFTATEQAAMVMGDTVVFQDEVDAAMDAAIAGGLEVTALHNHFFYDEPKVYFMHIGGHGDPESLAGAVKAMWDAIKRVRAKNANPAVRFGSMERGAGKAIDAAEISTILGLKATTLAGGVVKASIGRSARMHGTEFGGSMGLSTWAAFSGSDETASIDGDFAMSAEEVQPVLRALRAANIHIVALHNHMIGDDPATMFVHYWAEGPAAELAKSFRSVLDAQALVAQ
jgi:hypothetical protein